MIEPIMYFVIGFLVASLLGLAIVPLVHNRAVRLTRRHLEAATPLYMAQIQAEKDLLRAEFAMSTRRLEMSVDQLKARSTSQLCELGKKSEAINRLKVELGEKTATISSIEARLGRERRDADAATKEMIEERTKVENLGNCVDQLERQLVAQVTEAEILGRRVQDLEMLLCDQGRLLVEREYDVTQMRDELDAARNSEIELRAQLAATEVRRNSDKVNLNIATAADLDNLPQIGETRSKAIIEARGKRKFKSWDDFVARRVLPANVEAAIKDLVSF